MAEVWEQYVGHPWFTYLLVGRLSFKALKDELYVQLFCNIYYTVFGQMEYESYGNGGFELASHVIRQERVLITTQACITLIVADIVGSLYWKIKSKY